jgi:MFS family permease
MIVGRIITGMQVAFHGDVAAERMVIDNTLDFSATGLITSSIPTWVSETASASQRGGLVAGQLAIVSLGIAMANAINLGMNYLEGNQAAWRECRKRLYMRHP